MLANIDTVRSSQKETIIRSLITPTKVVFKYTSFIELSGKLTIAVHALTSSIVLVNKTMLSPCNIADSSGKLSDVAQV